MKNERKVLYDRKLLKRVLHQKAVLVVINQCDY